MPGISKEKKNPEDYLEVTPQPPLEVPDGLNADLEADPFPIPLIPEQPKPFFYPKKPPLPDAMYAKDNRNEVRLQRLGDRNWLAIPEPPTTAWPKMKQFFADNGVQLTDEAPDVGRLNTEWLEVGDDAYRDVVRTIVQEAHQELGLSSGSDRFIVRLEQGLQPQSTEIHIRHENDAEGEPAANEIVSLLGLQSVAATAERRLLNEIGAYIAARVAETTVSKVALRIGSEQKSVLSKDVDGLPRLLLFLDRERAWATLGQALRNADIVIENQDRETGRMQVAVSSGLFDGKSSGGFLCRFTFSCGSRGGDYSLEIVLSAGPDDSFQVRVTDAEQVLQNPEFAQQLLVMIREYAT